MQLESRMKNRGRIIVGTNEIGKDLKSPSEPKIGDKISLKSKGIMIRVKILTSKDQAYTGEIIDFDNLDPNNQFEEVVGSVVEFNLNNIIVMEV